MSEIVPEPASEPVVSVDRNGDPKARSHRLFRWLLAILIVAVITPVGLIGSRWRQQMDFLKRHDDVDVGVFLKSNIETRPVGAGWMRNLIGDDRMRGFDEIVVVQSLQKASAEDLQFLSHQPIEELHLFDTQLTADGIEALGKMRELREVEFGSVSSLSEPLLRELSGLEKLERLQFTDTGGFYAQTIVLDAPSTRTVVLDPIAVTDRATRIDSSLSPQSLSLLRELPNLKSLSFRKMKINDEYLAEIARLWQLESLDLAVTDVTDDGVALLAELPQLKHLNLSFTGVGDEGVAHFHNHAKLEVFDLVDTKLSYDGCERLRANLPQCDVNLTFETLHYPE